MKKQINKLSNEDSSKDNFKNSLKAKIYSEMIIKAFAYIIENWHNWF